jgi:ubiquinone/menaquinone biosynthesis C-methylase UbiE
LRSDGPTPAPIAVVASKNGEGKAVSITAAGSAGAERLVLPIPEAEEQEPRGLLSTFIAGYRQDVRRLFTEHSYEEAIDLAVGGSWNASAALEAGALRLAGIEAHHDLVDVGCGAGRLAQRLREKHRGRYLGTDIIPELLAHAQHLAPEWEFQLVESCTIPWPDRSADAVCFFSVFTHLPHEASYTYLQEAARVLRPGGRIVLSFLEFAEPDHWTIFGPMVDTVETRWIHNQFLHRDDLHRWAEHIGLRVERVVAGSENVVPIDGTYMMDDGRVLVPPAPFIQSLAVLRKPGPANEGPGVRFLGRRRRRAGGHQGVY